MYDRVKRGALLAIAAVSLLAVAPTARASSEYDSTAYDYIQQGYNLAMNAYETYGGDYLYYAYLYGYYAELYAYYAMEYNYRDYWLDAADCALWAAEFASGDENGYYAYDSLIQGYYYALDAYANFYSTAWWQ